MISFPISFPSVLAKTVSVKWTPRTLAAINQNAFTGQQQTVQYQGEWWELDITTAKLGRADADTLEAFLTSLRGRVGTFYYGDPARKSSRGGASGWSCNATAAGSRSITVFGGTGTITPGDWIQVGTQLFRVLQVTGLVVDVFPLVRSAIGYGAAIIHNTPMGVFRLNADVSFQYSLSKSAFGEYTISAMEAF